MPVSSLAYPAVSNRCTGLPLSSHTACSFEFRPPFVRPIQRGTVTFGAGWPPFGGPSEGANRSSGRLWARAVAQLAEDLMEDPRSTPAHKPIVARFIWPIRVRGILPLRAVPDDIDAPDHHQSISHSQDTARQGAKRC